MAVIRPKDEPSVSSPASGDRLILDGATVRSILYDNLLTSALALPAFANVAALASLVGSDGMFPYFTAPGAMTMTPITSYVRSVLGAGSAPSFRNAIGLAIGTHVQAWSANLDAFASKTAPGGDVVGTNDLQALTGKVINASNNTVSNLTTSMFAANVVDNDGTLSANSSTRLPTQAAVKAALDAVVAAADAMVFKGVIDCSTTPNYPAADRGHTYKVSVSGKIGGAAGIGVEAGDTLFCITDGTAAGTQAAVGAQWNVVQANLVGAVTGPAASTSGNIATFNGTGGTVIQDSGKALPAGTIVGTSDAQALTGKTYNGLTVTSTTGTLTLAAAKTLTANNSLTFSGNDGSSIAFGAGGTVAYTANRLSAFAATTSAELAGVISDETGTGALVFANAPTLVNPIVGTQAVGDNSTKAASTAFVLNAVAAAVAGVSTFAGQAGALTVDGGSMASSVMKLLRYDAAQPLTGPEQSRARANAGVGVRGADIASAATLDLQSATGDLVDVTGTTTITAITLNDGEQRTVRFTGALLLTHSASLVLQGGVSRTTIAGDFAVFRGYAAGVVRCVSYYSATDLRDLPPRVLTGFGSATTSLNLSGIDVVIYSGVGACTISNYSEVVVNKLYMFVNDSASSFTLNRNSAYLHGGSNSVMQTNHVQLARGRTSSTLTGCAPVSANG